MTYFKASELRALAGGLTASAAGGELAHMEKSSDGRYDIFLSHSFLDANAILGLKRLLESEGLKVYIDWIEDKGLDRSAVSPSTAQRIRARMDSCRSLVYATSRNASRSRWMPWELGYFDAANGPERVSICPIENGASGSYAGQEYLGLYKTIENLYVGGRPSPFAVANHRTAAESLNSFGLAKGQWVPVTN